MKEKIQCRFIKWLSVFVLGKKYPFCNNKDSPSFDELCPLMGEEDAECSFYEPKEEL